MSEIKLAIQMAYETAEKEFPHGHLKGEQIKAFLASAMALVDTQQAMLMNGKTVSAGTFKLKAFPSEKLFKPVEENFLSTVVGVPRAVVEKEEDTEQIPTPKMKFDAESFMTLSPKQAIEIYF